MRLSALQKEAYRWFNGPRGMRIWPMDPPVNQLVLQLTDELFMSGEKQNSVAFRGTPAQVAHFLLQFLVLAQSFGVDMESTVWQKFPNLCPYCGKNPCGGKAYDEKPHRMLNLPLPPKGMSVEAFQKMFLEIYGRASLEFILKKIKEEASEISSSCHYDTKELLGGIEPNGPGISFPLPISRATLDEFADAFAWMMQLANALGIELKGLPFP